MTLHEPSCWTDDLLRSPRSTGTHSDDGFMGFTHSMSAIAVSLALIAFAPTFVYSVFGVDDTWMLVMFTLVSAGYALVPDFDNVRAKAISAFGVLGGAMSTFFRGSSLFVQTMIRKKGDDADPDPHRGFWHTALAAILTGIFVLGLTKIGGSLTLPILGEHSYGTLVGILFAFFGIHLMFEGVLKSTVDKIKKQAGPLGTIAALVLSIATTEVLFVNMPTIDMQWLGIAIAYGMIVHVIGDCFTSAGAPLLFPIPGIFKHKLWWKSRIPPGFAAGGTIENAIVIPLLFIMSFISLFVILTG